MDEREKDEREEKDGEKNEAENGEEVKYDGGENNDEYQKGINVMDEKEGTADAENLEVKEGALEERSPMEEEEVREEVRGSGSVSSGGGA